MAERVDVAALRAEWERLETQPRDNALAHAVDYRSLARRLLAALEAPPETCPRHHIPLVLGCAICEAERARAGAVLEAPPRYEQDLAHLATLPAGWDSYAGAPITPAALAAVRAFISGLQIVPRSNGGLQIEIHRARHDVEVSFEPDGSIESVYAENPDEAGEAPPEPRDTILGAIAALDDGALEVMRGELAQPSGAAFHRDTLRRYLMHGVRGEAPPQGLNLSAVNLARCTAPDGFNHPLASWSPAEWTNAVAGEAGEACNLAKKLIRHRDGVPGNKKAEDQDTDSLRRRIAEELADVVIYCDLAMASVGYDFATVVRDVFNRKSAELGSPYVLDGLRGEAGPLPLGLVEKIAALTGEQIGRMRAAWDETWKQPSTGYDEADAAFRERLLFELRNEQP